MSLFAPRRADGDRVDIGGVEVRLRVNPRAKRFILRIDPIGGEAVAVAPSRARLGDALAFARTRRNWLLKRLAALADSVEILGRASAERTPYRSLTRVASSLGEDEEVRPCLPPQGEATRRQPSGRGSTQPTVALAPSRDLRREALGVFTELARGHCARLGTALPRLAITDTRSRWGSCSPARPGRSASIRLSWRLMLAPPEVADYVVAHECAHLVEANHGACFWALVGELVGDVRPHRTWLKAHGAGLHRL